MNKVILIFAITFFAASCNQPVSQKNNMLKINGKEIYIEVASSPSAREKGLSGRTSLGENAGMLFVFPESDLHSFWMKDTLIPLDIIWIADSTVVDITTNVQIEQNVTIDNLKRYKPVKPVDQVLEVKAGFVDKNGIKIGDKVTDLTF